MDQPKDVPEHHSSQQEVPHLDRDPDCTFCTIIKTYPPISPSATPGNKLLDPYKLDPPAFVVLSTEHVVAFLDVYPLVRGHVLICPRRHGVKVGDLRGDEGAEIGRLLPLVARALVYATVPDVPHSSADYNIVQNNGPGAAQVIPHTHFHFVPRYPFDYQPISLHPVLSSNAPLPNENAPTNDRMSSGRQYPANQQPKGMEATRILFGRGQRHYRDEEDSEELVEVMRRCVKMEWEREFGVSMISGASANRETRKEKGGKADRDRSSGGRL